jgi:hypothetical protein
MQAGPLMRASTAQPVSRIIYGGGGEGGGKGVGLTAEGTSGVAVS